MFIMYTCLSEIESFSLLQMFSLIAASIYMYVTCHYIIIHFFTQWFDS